MRHAVLSDFLTLQFCTLISLLTDFVLATSNFFEMSRKLILWGILFDSLYCDLTIVRISFI